MQKFQYSDITILKLFNCLFKYLNIPISKILNIPKSKNSNSPIFRYINIIISQYFNISILQQHIISIFHYLNIPISQYLNISIFKILVFQLSKINNLQGAPPKKILFRFWVISKYLTYSPFSLLYPNKFT